MGRNNKLLVPDASNALRQLKLEVARELGLELPADGYYGNMTSRDLGSIGGSITRRLILMAEQSLGK